MLEALEDPRVRQVIDLEGGENWRQDLERLMAGDQSLNRHSAGEAGIRGVQRLFIFLGYSTAATGAFSIDGNFGRGTNRALAQFLYDQGLTHAVTRDHLTYEARWNTAAQKIVAIPDTRLDVESLDRMLNAARQAIDDGDVALGDFDHALEHLNLLHQRRGFDCAQIAERYGHLVESAVATIESERGVTLVPEWVLAIIRQETAGVVRPRFEQHLLSRYHRDNPDEDLAELRYRSMSFGLGQILGVNASRVGAPSARAMFSSPVAEQVLYIARFLASYPDVRPKLELEEPTLDDFAVIARRYNGPAYASHHYHESIQGWFREFRRLRAG